MAEFTEVMRQARRMCEAFRDGHCGDCPIGDAEMLECGITVTSEMDCADVERRVMQWAEGHPEPVYPTWREWYDAAFPEAVHRNICPATFGDEYTGCGKDACGMCVERTIPAEIAEKLGIKPIAADKPAPAHDGCGECKYVRMGCDDEPCKRCRGNIGDPAPDLWQAG